MSCSNLSSAESMATAVPRTGLKRMRLTCMLSCFSRLRLFSTLWTVAHQAPLSMGFFRQDYWSGLPCPPPGDLLDPGIEPGSPALQADSLPTETPGNPKSIFQPLYSSLFPEPPCDWLNEEKSGQGGVRVWDRKKSFDYLVFLPICKLDDEFPLC